nr:hypothetical protein [Tanacetum cinerariifolium]
PNEPSSQGIDSCGGPRCQEAMGILLLKLEMFDVNDLDGEEVFVAEQEVVKDVNENVVEEVVNTSQDTAKRLQAEFDEKERLARERERAPKEKEPNIALIETWDDIQAKIDADHQLAEKLQAQEQEELSDAKKATLFVQLLEKRRMHFLAKRAEEKKNHQHKLKRKR